MLVELLSESQVDVEVKVIDGNDSSEVRFDLVQRNQVNVVKGQEGVPRSAISAAFPPPSGDGANVRFDVCTCSTIPRADVAGSSSGR